MKNKKRKILWNRVFIALALLMLGGYSIVTLFTVTTVKHTPVGDYTCNGAILKVCSGSNAVANYLGVE